MIENEIGKHVVDVAFKIHKNVGSGLLETVYEVILAFELRRRGLRVERQISIPVTYEGFKFDEGFRVDLIVETKVIVELKSVERLNNAHRKQLLTYLRLADKKLGYPILASLREFFPNYLPTIRLTVVVALPPIFNVANVFAPWT